jgi:hypothetical protein
LRNRRTAANAAGNHRRDAKTGRMQKFPASMLPFLPPTSSFAN